MKQEAWVEDKVDEEIDKKGQVEKADETKQNVEYTLPTVSRSPTCSLRRTSSTR